MRKDPEVLRQIALAGDPGYSDPRARRLYRAFRELSFDMARSDARALRPASEFRLISAGLDLECAPVYLTKKEVEGFHIKVFGAFQSYLDGSDRVSEYIARGGDAPMLQRTPSGALEETGLSIVTRRATYQSLADWGFICPEPD